MRLASMRSFQHHPLGWFFALAYAVSWAFWLPAAFAARGWIDPVPSAILHFAGGLGPMISAIVVTGLAGDGPGLSRLAGRSGTGGRWLILAIAFPTMLFLMSTQIVSLVYGAPIEWRNTGVSPEEPNMPLPLYWMANVVFYGYGEEVGWRGFALPRLQSRFSALRASVVLTAGWAAWHLPLFAFSAGLSGLGLPGTIGWVLSLLLGSVVLTWLFNSSGGSIATVALFHAALDVFITSPVSPYLPNVMGASLTLVALALVPAFGSENLARRARVVEPPTAPVSMRP